MPRILSRIDLVPKKKKPWSARASSSPTSSVVGSRSVMSRDAPDTCRHEGISYRIVSEENLLSSSSTALSTSCVSSEPSLSSDAPKTPKHRREPSDDWGHYVDFQSPWSENRKVIVLDEAARILQEEEFSDQVGLMGFEPPLKRRA